MRLSYPHQYLVCAESGKQIPLSVFLKLRMEAVKLPLLLAELIVPIHLNSLSQSCADGDPSRK